MRATRFFLRNLVIPLALFALFYIPSVAVEQTLANPDSALQAILNEIKGAPFPFFGIITCLRLPVREYPDIDPPIISVITRYRGVSPSVVETEITGMLEE